jgi:hypothetical protein
MQHLRDQPISVDSKPLMERTKSFRCNTYKKQGEGVSVMVNQKSGGPNGNLLAPFLFSAFPPRPLRLRVILCLFTLNFQLSTACTCKQKKREQTSPPPLNATAAISYLWPECVIRARMSRRLSSTLAPANSARSAGLHLLIVVLMAVAHLSMPSALG